MNSMQRAAPVVEDRPDIAAGPLLGGGRLVRDYLDGVDLSAYFTGHYTDPAAYARKAAEVEHRLDRRSRALVAPAIEPLGDSADRLERIIDGEGFFVTTGQQPALFGGPLYTLCKVLGAIRLADVLEGQLGKPVLALFWIGSDDHDWAEANHSSLLGAQEYVQRITVRAPRDAPLVPLSQRAWGAGVRAAVDEFAAILPDSPCRSDVIAHVREAYVPGATVAESFTATMKYLLGGRRVAIVDSAHPALRRAAAPLMRAEVQRTREHNVLLLKQAERLEQDGYAAQVTIAEDAANLMLIGESGRDRLMRTDRGWSTRRERSAIDEAHLLDMIDAEPDRFSPNVLLRPVVESAVFPTLAYVGGPGEVSYLAQIGCLFTAHGILPPVVVPRPSVTLIPPKAAALLNRLRITPAQLNRPFRDVVADAISAEVPQRVDRALRALRAALTTGYDDLAEAASTIDPGLRGALMGTRNASLLDVNAAEGSIHAQLRRTNQVRIEQLRRAAAHVQPEGVPQERVLGPLPFVAGYGLGVVADIEAALNVMPPVVATWEGPRCT